MQGKRVAISGSGNVAIYAAEKCMQLGAKVVTLSDSNGVFYEEDGFTREGLDAVDDLKVTRKGKLSEHSSKSGQCGQPALYPKPLKLALVPLTSKCIHVPSGLILTVAYGAQQDMAHVGSAAGLLL